MRILEIAYKRLLGIALSLGIFALALLGAQLNYGEPARQFGAIGQASPSAGQDSSSLDYHV